MTRPPISSPLFPYTTLFRSHILVSRAPARDADGPDDRDAVVDHETAGRGEQAPPMSDDEAHRGRLRSEEHTSELQSLRHLVCRLLLEKKKTTRRRCPARTRK